MGTTPKKRYPRTVRELVDHDYTGSLSPQDAEYLAKFDDEYYGASFADNPLHTDEDQRREIYRIKNARNGDIYGKGVRGASVGGTTEVADEEREWTTAPEYLESKEYKTALDEFRANLATDGRKNAALTREFITSQRKIYAAAGVVTREGKGAFVAKSRIEKLKSTREVVMNLGVTVTKCNFPGGEAQAVVAMLNWLTGMLGQLDRKLAALGVTPGEGVTPETEGAK